MRPHRASIAIASALAVLATLGLPFVRKVAKGLIDPNVASESELWALPHMTPARVRMVS